jgi:multicomponent K+:H+ antiporter subunit G
MASMIVFSIKQGSLSVHEMIITLFLFMTAPIAAHMMAKAALHLAIPAKVGTRNPAVMEQARVRRTDP